MLRDLSLSEGNSVKSRLLGIFALFAIVASGGVFLIYHHSHPTPKASRGPDILCAYVSDSLGMRCVQVLGADTLLGPGAIVDFPAPKQAHDLVPLPNAQLFSDSCVVPGEQINALTSSLHNQQNTISLQSMTFHSERKLHIGAELPIPRFPNIEIKAGPQASDITDVTLAPSDVHAELLDENQFLDALENFGIRKVCIDRLRKSQYQVVAKALVGTLDYAVTDNNSQSLSLDAALTKGLLNVSAGGATLVDSKQILKNVSGTPVVIAVEFLKPEILAQRPALEKDVVYSPSGQTSVAVAGAGAGGQNYLPPLTKSATIGQQASVQSNGTEASECQSGYERSQSLGSLAAQLQSSNEGRTLQVSLDGTIRGGHYATFASCPFGNPIGKTGHDTGVTAHYSSSGSIRTTVRSDAPRHLTVTFTDLPPQTSITVRGPNGELIPSTPPHEGGSQTFEGSGSADYRISGAGVYLVEFASILDRTINGASSLGITNRAEISVQVE